MAEIVLIRPDWPAPGRVRAVATTRAGGFSTGPWTSLNLGTHVGDDPAAVAANRARLAAAAALPAEPAWLEQVHGARVVDAADPAPGPADGAVATRPGVVCAVLTADCLPILVCDRAGTRVAALHGGWRGLAAGILEAGLAALDRDPGELLAWLGPAIGPARYQVDDAVRDAFPPADHAAFRSDGPGHWRLDLAGLARARLARAGVGAVYGGHACTHAEPARFFSHRRDGRSGRQAALAWLA